MDWRSPAVNFAQQKEYRLWKYDYKTICMINYIIMIGAKSISSYLLLRKISSKC